VCFFICGFVLVPPTWDGGNIRLAQTGYNGATVTYNHIYTHGTSPTATWVYLESKILIDADTSGYFSMVATSAPTAGRTVYMDAFQVEQNADYATTYIDGDQPGCKWNGLVNQSTSTRSAQERSGGRVVDLEATYSVKVRHQAGSGMAFSSHRSQKQALIPGATFQGTKPEPRTLTLLCTPLATSAANLHAIRDDLVDAVKPDLVTDDQEVTLRYTGSNANKPVEIKAVYDSGLEFGEPRGKIENIPLRFICYDPYWYEIGNGAGALTTSVSETHSYLSRRVDGNWEDMDGTGAVTAIVVTTQYLYLGGAFNNWDAIANADYIVRYDKSAGTFSAMGTGLDAAVKSMVLGPDGALYVGGQFTLAGGVANTDGIAKWDGANWSALGTGVSGGTGIVYALAFDQTGNLYAAGDFTQMGGVANTAYIAKWNGAAWSALSTGLGGIGRALAVDQANNLYIGGAFTNLGDANGDRLVKWNGSAFSSLSTGMDNTVYALAIDVDNSLYAAGAFTTAGGVSAVRIAKWNGTTFKALGDGLTGGDAYFLSIIDGLLYASGGFTSAGGLTVDRAAIWNGSTWAYLDIDLSGSVTIWVTVKDQYTGYLYIGYDTTGTSLTSAVNTITNSGTTRAYPKITINRSGGTSATVAYLKNNTTGATLWLNYALLDGETLTLDFTPGARSISSSMFGTVWRALLKPSDFSQFYLLPGSNSIIAFVNVVGSPTMTQYLTFPLSHWSVDGVA